MNFKFLQVVVPMAVLLFAFASCEKEDTNNLTDDEAADLVENNVSPETSGFTEQATLSALMADQVIVKSNPWCGIVFDTTITRQKTTGVRTYDYTFNWSRTLNCTSLGLPQSVSFSYQSSGTYDAPKMSSADSASHTFTISDLQPAQTEYSYTGSYIRTGTQTSKVGQQLTFNTTFTATSSNVKIDKTTRKVNTGTINFTITGTVSNGNTINKSGTVVFNGNGTATITIGAKTWTIQL